MRPSVEQIRRDLEAAKAAPQKEMTTQEGIERFWKAMADRDRARRELESNAVEYITFLLDVIDGRPELEDAIYAAFPAGQQGVLTDHLVDAVRARGYTHNQVMTELQRLVAEGKLSAGPGTWLMLR
jgi:hypothetical protein